MKNNFITTCVMTLLSVQSFAQLSVASTSVTIVNSIEFSKVGDMRFETTIAGSNINRNSSLPATLNNPGSTSIVETAAEFNISDQANNFVSVTITALPISFNQRGNKVILRNLKNEYENQNTPVNGKQSVKIRGDLYIDSNAEAGLYSNSRDMVVVINYN